jgi:hypothetical protein
MIANGGKDSPKTSAAVTSHVLQEPRLMRAVLAGSLAIFLWSSPAVTLAGETMDPAAKLDNTLVFGLTATQLAIAAAIGAGAGAAGALVSGNLIAGASLGFGTLAAVYVAHLAAEAVVVGGVYYWWPWEAKPEAPVSRTMVIRGTDTGRDPISSLRLAH